MKSQNSQVLDTIWIHDLAKLWNIYCQVLEKYKIVCLYHMKKSARVYFSKWWFLIKSSTWICRDATFQEISWNQEISVRKKELQEKWKSVARYKKLIKKGGKGFEKGKCIKIHLFKTKMAIYSILYCLVMYFNAVIISELMRPLYSSGNLG